MIVFNHYLNYPYRYHSKNLIKIVAVQFILVFLFLFLFRPFNVNESENRYSYLLICFLHALIPALVVFIYFNFINHLKKASDKTKWTLIYELLHLAAIFLIIGICGFLLRNMIYNNPNNWSLRYLWEEIRNTYLAGGLLSSYLIFARFYATHNKSKAPDDFTIALELLPQRQLINAEVFIKTQVKTDDFNFDPSRFLFARAEGNYTELMFSIDGAVKKELKRISLKQLEHQLSIYPQMIRTHRAYLLNIEQVASISGNSQGYAVSFHEVSDTAPVSRAHLKDFSQLYNPSDSIN